jgi:serine/threonine protein kinase
MSKNLPDNVIKPLELVYMQKKFAGYIMPKVEGEDFKRLANKKFLQINNITIKEISSMLIQIKDILKILHSQNIFISDLNDCNILFDKSFKVFFIDTDSWTIDGFKCAVCMDSFKDPFLKGNDFSKETDSFAYGVLAFKSLTRLHPFGGTTNPDMDIVERMKQKSSVIDNQNVVIPRTATKWIFMNPSLVKDFKDIFESGSRSLIDANLEEFKSHLKKCDKHSDFYYSEYSDCPLCNDKAALITAPVKIQDAGGIPYVVLFTMTGIKTILDQDSCILESGEVLHIRSMKRSKFLKTHFYYFSNDGSIRWETTKDKLYIYSDKDNFAFDKRYNSEVVVKDTCCYYTDLANNLIKLIVTDYGIGKTLITKTAITNFFEIVDDKNYLVINVYDNLLIINNSGYNLELQSMGKIVNYGIHYDSYGNWLVILENSKGKFYTYVLSKNNITYQSDSIKYTISLSNLTFYNNTIFKPGQGKITGFHVIKNIYKDFPCTPVTEDSKLIRKGNKFTIIDDTTIYEAG